ncbi:MAG: hypothetical protein WC587_02985 [Candidatus Paceibacterota bacterium]
MQSIKQIIITLAVCLAVVAGVNLVYGWTGPTATPPGGNVPAPINIGGSGQVTGYQAKGGSIGAYDFWISSANKWASQISGGVSKIIAGTNITISPASGIGDVTINSTGGSGGVGTLQQVTDAGNTTTNYLLTYKNFYWQASAAANTVVGLGELQQAKADFPGKAIFGLGFDKVTGWGGILVPAGTWVGLFDDTGSFSSFYAKDYYISASNRSNKYASDLVGHGDPVASTGACYWSTTNACDQGVAAGNYNYRDIVGAVDFTNKKVYCCSLKVQ